MNKTIGRIICIALAVLICLTACYAENTDAPYKSNLPPWISDPNRPKPFEPDTLLFSTSYNQGKLDAEHFHPSVFRFAAGLGSGLVLPFLGIAISESLTNGTPPDAVPAQVDSAFYTKGYLEKTKLKNRNMLILGGLTGSAITTVAIILYIQAMSSMGPMF